jgi:hypothetical protein
VFTDSLEVKIEGGVISKTKGSVYNAKVLYALDPRSSNRSKEGVFGFVKRETLYSIGDDLTVKPLSANSCFLYLKKLGITLDDLEVKMISIGEGEVSSILFAIIILFYISIIIVHCFSAMRHTTIFLCNISLLLFCIINLSIIVVLVIHNIYYFILKTT